MSKAADRCYEYNRVINAFQYIQFVIIEENIIPL